MKLLKLILLGLFLLATLLSSAGCGIKIAKPNKWLFLVYMDGDNNLEPEAIKDFNEMEQVGSTNDITILVLFDRSPGYDSSNGDWKGTRLYKVTKDENTDTISSQLVTASPWGKRNIEADMSSPDTLRNFIGYCQTYFPAGHTVLTLWDHGYGVYPKSLTPYKLEKTKKSTIFQNKSGDAFTGKGICWDDTTPTDIYDWNCLTTDEVAKALAGARAKTLKKVDLINMDACLMQMLEVAYEWKNETDYLVGSEETVPGDGNSYNTVLGKLAANPDMSVEELATTLVDDYYAVYNYPGYDTTYSALKLGAPLDTLIVSFKALATKLKDTTDLNGVYNAWYNTSWFGSRPEISDLYDFACKLGDYSTDPEVVTAAANLKDSFLGLVLRHQETGEHTATGIYPAYGLAVTTPSCNEWMYYSGDNQYVTLNLSKDTDWDEFVLRFVEYTRTL